MDVSADRSSWIAAGLEARKPTLGGELAVERLGGNAYRVTLRLEGEELPIAELRPAATPERWRLFWTSGDGRWRPLDENERDLTEVLDAIARDDYGCFLG